MPAFEPKDPDFRARVTASFARQTAMASLGVTILRLEPGEIELAMPYDGAFTQQHGFTHAGIISTALDSSCGYAAYSLTPPETSILTIEFKTSLLSPAKGERFTFCGRVIRAGRNIIFCEAEAIAHNGGATKRIAVMTATLMAISGPETMGV